MRRDHVRGRCPHGGCATCELATHLRALEIQVAKWAELAPRSDEEVETIARTARAVVYRAALIGSVTEPESA